MRAHDNLFLQWKGILLQIRTVYLCTFVAVFNSNLSSSGSLISFGATPRSEVLTTRQPFRPRAALPNEVTLLIPNIFNTGEMVPVNVPKSELLNVYMTIFRNQLTEGDILEEEEDGQATGGPPAIPPEW